VSAAEWWCLAAAIAAGLSVVGYLVDAVRADGTPLLWPTRLGAPLLAAAVALLAVALLVALP
jgi:hypothetical protein